MSILLLLSRRGSRQNGFRAAQGGFGLLLDRGSPLVFYYQEEDFISQ